MFENIHHIPGLTVSPIFLRLYNTESSDQIQTTFSSTQTIFYLQKLHLNTAPKEPQGYWEKSKGLEGCMV